MLRTASLTLFGILGCSTVFAQTKKSIEPFDVPGEIVSQPSNPHPEKSAIVPVSAPATATIAYPPTTVIQCKQASCAPGGRGQGRPVTGILANRHDSASDCLDRFSNWLFYRNPPWPHNCAWVPQQFHTPGYAYFYHPTAAESRPCLNLAQPGCSTCVAQVPPAKPEVNVVVKPEPRPLIPNTSAAMAQLGDPTNRTAFGKTTMAEDDGEPYYYPRVTAPQKSQGPNLNGASLPDPNR